MLKAQRDFEMQHFFARALKTEVPRLDDTRICLLYTSDAADE